MGIFQNSKSFGFVVPDDRKFGTDVFISKNNFGGARNNQKVVVRIDQYSDGTNKTRRYYFGIQVD